MVEILQFIEWQSVRQEISSFQAQMDSVAMCPDLCLLHTIETSTLSISVFLFTSWSAGASGPSSFVSLLSFQKPTKTWKDHHENTQASALDLPGRANRALWYALLPCRGSWKQATGFSKSKCFRYFAVTFSAISHQTSPLTVTRRWAYTFRHHHVLLSYIFFTLWLPRNFYLIPRLEEPKSHRGWEWWWVWPLYDL